MGVTSYELYYCSLCFIECVETIAGNRLQMEFKSLEYFWRQSTPADKQTLHRLLIRPHKHQPGVDGRMAPRPGQRFGPRTARRSVESGSVDLAHSSRRMELKISLQLRHSALCRPQGHLQTSQELVASRRMASRLYEMSWLPRGSAGAQGSAHALKSNGTRGIRTLHGATCF